MPTSTAPARRRAVLWLEANGRVDHAPDGTPLSFPGVLIDVNERRAVEAERDRATTMLRALTRPWSSRWPRAPPS